MNNVFKNIAKKFLTSRQTKTEHKGFYNVKNYDSRTDLPRIEYSTFSNYTNYATKGYTKNPVAFRAINIIAHTTSAIPLIVMKQEKNKKYNLIGDPLSNLVNQPNPYTSKVDFIETIIYQLLINGNAFLLKIRDSGNRIQEIYNLNPDNIEFLFDNGGYAVTGYRYHKENGKSRDYRIDRLTNDCDILHLKNFNPNDEIYGLSPFAAASNAIEQHNAVIEWNKSLLKNGARPSSALMIKNSKDFPLTDSQRNELKKELDYLFSGPSNTGRPILLDGGMEWKDLSISPKELDFASSDQIAIRHIANAFGVPVQMLNSPESTSYNNYLEGKKSLYENTVLPLLNKIISNIYNHWVCNCFGPEYFVTYNEDDIPALSYKKEQLLNNLKNSNFLTINEKRAILGFDPIPDGDKLDG